MSKKNQLKGIDTTKTTRKIAQYDSFGKLIEIHNSINQCCNKLYISSRNLHKVLNGMGKTLKEFNFKYV